MPFIAKNADDQLGRVIDALKAQARVQGHSDRRPRRSRFDIRQELLRRECAGRRRLQLVWGYSINDGPYYDTPTPPAAAIKPLTDTGNVAFSYQSTAIETWLKDTSAAKKMEAAHIMSTLPGVIATYVKSPSGNCYRLDSKSPTMTPRERSWWRKHGQELVNTMALVWLGRRSSVCSPIRPATVRSATTAARRGTCSASPW